MSENPMEKSFLALGLFIVTILVTLVVALVF